LPQYPLDITAETLTIKGYQLINDVLSPGDTLRLKVCFTGQHAENPNLFVKAINPITQQPVGSVDTYPGMAPTNDLAPSGVIYCAPVALRIPSSKQPLPVQLKLQFGWNVPGHFVRLKDANGQAMGSLIVDGPTLIDPAQKAEAAVTTNVTYGDGILLTGYSLSSQSVTSGSDLTIALRWRDVGRMTTNFVVAIGLLDSNNKPVVQADGEVAGYPTSAWRPGPDFTDTRKLTIPADLPPGPYTIYVGWYDPANGNRLTAHGDGVVQNSNLLEISIK
jgi:hypothetical protein